MSIIILGRSVAEGLWEGVRMSEVEGEEDRKKEGEADSM